MTWPSGPLDTSVAVAPAPRVPPTCLHLILAEKKKRTNDSERRDSLRETYNNFQKDLEEKKYYLFPRRFPLHSVCVKLDVARLSVRNLPIGPAVRQAVIGSRRADSRALLPWRVACVPPGFVHALRPLPYPSARVLECQLSLGRPPGFCARSAGTTWVSRALLQPGA